MLQKSVPSPGARALPEIMTRHSSRPEALPPASSPAASLMRSKPTWLHPADGGVTWMVRPMPAPGFTRSFAISPPQARFFEEAAKIVITHLHIIGGRRPYRGLLRVQP